jgi:hypothetical protein
VVTHLTTNPPVRCLNRAERTGSLVFNVLWSYVEELLISSLYIWLSQHYAGQKPAISSYSAFAIDYQYITASTLQNRDALQLVVTS